MKKIKLIITLKAWGLDWKIGGNDGKNSIWDAAGLQFESWPIT